MDGVANMADAMLILAVGLMLALIVAWDVDVVNKIPDINPVDVGEVVELTEAYENLEKADAESDNAQSLDEYGLEEYGKVYRDAEGNLYIIDE